ncbi:MAG: PASTA domain-containing protein [Flavobacterium sp.]|nr:MAG: PASTA domain-containing protein [Flavobacterium sp.]
MTFREFIKTKTFFLQLLYALCIIIAIVLGFMYWLDFTTNHGEEITVPNLARMTEAQAEEKLDDLNLDYVILDSVDYRKDFPKYSVVEQEPSAGSKVKKDRKIYIKLNSAGFTSVRMPDLIEKTLRQAEPTLKAIGLEIGTLTYVPYLGKDMVLKMKLNGKEIKPGDKVLKSSKIDIVLGDGKVGFDDTEIDSLANQPVPPPAASDDTE